jgi:U3 small nucleolar RNA-associated protein 10
MVIKLNESAFKPIFRRLYDWAFANDTGMWLVVTVSALIITQCGLFRYQASSRKTSFCRVYTTLLEFFKVVSRLLACVVYDVTDERDHSSFSGLDDALYVVPNTTFG